MRILLVEDSDRVRSTITATLRAAGFDVTGAADCAGARASLCERAFQAAVLDVGLPDGSGVDLCRELRRAGFDVPILLLTARTQLADRVEGLDAGADDYLGKPFASAELCARLRALGRRGPRWTESVRSFGDLTLDRDRRTAARSGATVALTAREFDVVALLAWAGGRVLSREHILESVWGTADERAAASLEVLLTRIRRKLEVQRGDCIRTVREAGYAWARDRSS
ncbi:MAG TPA: response regulator transcription factor [Labilithrix sp.]